MIKAHIDEKLAKLDKKGEMRHLGRLHALSVLNLFSDSRLYLLRPHFNPDFTYYQLKL